jgi:thioredoxin-like negative regulator of GroEL
MFQVQGIPCLIIIKDKKEAERIVGYNPKDKLKMKIDEILSRIK